MKEINEHKDSDKCQVIIITCTEMASKVFDKLYSLLLLLLPKLHVAILAGCDDEVFPKKKKILSLEKVWSKSTNKILPNTFNNLTSCHDCTG